MCSIYNTSSGCFSTISSYFMFTSSMKSKLAAGPSTWGWHEVRIGQVPLLRIILHSWQEVWEGQNLHQHRMREQNCGQWMHARLPQTVDIWQKTTIIGWGNSENTPFLENNGNHVGGIWNFCALLASVRVLLQLNEWDVRWRQCINAMASSYSCLRWSKSIQSTNSSLTLSLADSYIYIYHSWNCGEEIPKNAMTKEWESIGRWYRLDIYHIDAYGN